MESLNEEEHAVAFGQTEWSNYVQYRPRYPSSLINLIRDHHNQYCKSFNLAHDVASGAGVFVPVLADEFGFKHIHVSDPGPENIKSAQRILTAYYQQQRPRLIRNSTRPSATSDIGPGSNSKTILTFSKTSGEEMHMCAASGSVDLVTIMEAAHWMDGESLMASAAETLAPQGTLAIVIYAAAAWIKNNARANTAFRTALGALWAFVLQSKHDAHEPGAFEMERGLKQASTGLDWLPLDDEVWKNVRRIRLRGKDKGEYPHDNPYTDADHFAKSRVRPEETYETYEEGQQEAEGWDVEVDRDWFRGYLTSMEDPERVAGMKEYKELMTVLEEEFPEGQKVQVEWVVDVVLATQRSGGGKSAQ